ncbi:acyltransferase family protein [Noviluteimonas gilva]|nr:acyltransferase family protein [Lysobacter gilvus]
MGNVYRPEIDGLRAIAVLSVLAYHAGLGGAGFVGVDVFFVISGYLITSLLLKEHREHGTIDLLAFYARRVRRIVPAATLVVLVTLVAAWFLLDPLSQAQTARSAGASLAFFANVFFQLNTGGYWDAASDEMPLLHLWSLSVEEQFYFLWPALLLFTRSRKAMVALALASFALCEWWIAQSSDAAFFQMPARFWELAIGGLVAASSLRLPSWASALGVVVVLVACVVPIGHFPGIGAAPAVLGAALIVAGGSNRFLASKPMVWVGLISYSLYLWHWPLLALYRATDGDDLRVRLALCAVSVVLAIVTWKYVEQPFRKMRSASGRTVLSGAALSAVLAVISINVLRPYDPPTAVAIDRPDPTCRYLAMDTAFPKCPDPKGATVAVWGDSMAYSWMPMAGNAINYTRDACRPFDTQGECGKFNAQVMQRIQGVDTVIFAGWWIKYMPDLDPVLDKLTHTRRIVIVGPTPLLRTPVPKCLRGAPDCAVPRAEFDARVRPVYAKLHALQARYPNVEVLDVTDRFCTATECPPVLDGVPLYWDTHHVSATKARQFRHAW